MAEPATDWRREAATARDASPPTSGGRDLDTAWRLAYVVSGDEQAATTATTRAFAEIRTPPDGPPPSRAALLAATLRRSLDQASENRPEGPIVPPDSAVTSVLWELPARQRAGLWLTEVDHLNDTDLATVLGLPADKVDEVAHRAARWLDVALDHKSGPLCQHEPKLADYIDGNLALVEAAEIDDHLSGCPTCRSKVQAYEELADLPAVLGRAVPIPPTTLAEQAADLVDRDGKAPLAGSGESAPQAPPAVRPLAACCAGLLVIGLLGLSVVRPATAANHPGSTTRATTSVQSPLPGVSTDGSGAVVPVSPAAGAPATTSTTAQPVTFPTLPPGARTPRR